MNKIEKIEAPEKVSHKSLASALSAAQIDWQDPERNKEVNAGKMKFKYADLEGVLKAVRPVLFNHGLAISQHTEIENDTVILVTELYHESGESKSGKYPVATMNTNHKEMGAGMTYARRQALSAIVGIAATDDNDADGTGDLGAGPKQKMSAHQAKTEVNWGEVQRHIDGAPTFEKLINLEKRVDANKGVWPDSYVSVARERIVIRRLAIADERLGQKTDVDALNDEFTDIEAALDGKVVWDDLAALHKKHENRLIG